METSVNSRPEFSFENTAIAFRSKSNDALKKAQFLFSLFNYKWLLKAGPPVAKFSLSMGLPVKGLIKSTLFGQFCGGESIEDCANTIDQLAASNIGTILDYSVEGQEDEATFTDTMREIIRTIDAAAAAPGKIPFSVFKVTGIGRFGLLEKASKGNDHLTVDEKAEYQRMHKRFDTIIGQAAASQVRILVDAEETWIQPAIDQMTEEAAEKYNKETAIVYNTVQMYRHDRLAYLEQAIKTARQKGYKWGFKIVRGAYMEKERKRAQEMGYASPIQADKDHTDKDYNRAIEICLDNIGVVSICAGTHNEYSSSQLMHHMKTHEIAPSDPRVYFSQLLGMSDHISFNLADAGYNVAKYVPYGPVKEVLPYLVRRAEENSSVKGQAGRELSLIRKELKRRRSN